jgi:hypothetical protein
MQKRKEAGTEELNAECGSLLYPEQEYPPPLFFRLAPFLYKL